MHHRHTILCLMFSTLPLFAGCGANIELQKGTTELKETLQVSTFYLELHDGSKSRPDNLDGYLNYLWTSDTRRAALVTKHVVWLKEELAKKGFTFVDNIAEYSVHTELTIKSVRFDPFMGWLTDDA